MVPKVLMVSKASNTQALRLCVCGKLNHSYGFLLSSHWIELQNLSQMMRVAKTL